MRDFSTSGIDFRSDTITQAVSGMRQAMAQAEVGDDVLGDDPTVTELENRVAELCGKEAGLFVASGTMSNAIALKTHTQPGDEIITWNESHIYVYEGGGYAALCGCSIALVDGERGIMSPDNVRKAIRKTAGSQGHYPNGSLVCVENTSNRGGGTCYSQETLDEIAKIAKENGCKSHIDGARIFNAVISTGVPLSRMVRDYDSISICLSKGLGSPIGSVLVGSSEFIARAHKWRKMLGGGMRQAGHIAAAGIFALDNHIERMSEDHKRAKQIAEIIDSHPKFTVDMDTVETNMVYFKTDISASEVVDKFSKYGVKMFDLDPHSCRIVTHLHITDEDVDNLREIVQNI